MPYSIRPMTREDVAQVNEIDREAFPTQLPPPNYRHELENQLARYIVACDENLTQTVPAPEDNGFGARLRRWLGQKPPPGPSPTLVQQYIAGFAGIWVLSDEAHITNIAVRRFYQRRGIGELMMLSLFDLAQQFKTGILTLEVRASNDTAQSLYRKYGFVETGVRRGYYLDNREDAIIMSTEKLGSEALQTRLRQLREDLEKKLAIA